MFVESLDAVKELLAQRSGNDRDIRDAIAQAITRGDIDELRQVLKGQPRGVVNQRHRDSGSTPLSLAAMRGQLEIIKILIRRGARVNATNRDGNTALHTAAFFCREDIVKLLLAKGASTTTKKHSWRDTHRCCIWKMEQRVGWILQIARRFNRSWTGFGEDSN